jgi:rare lipoprotein A
MQGYRIARVIFLIVSASALGSCQTGNPFSTIGGAPSEEADGSKPAAEGGAPREVEAPDVLKISAKGLWDGRPSLGGVWVAHPDVSDPQRVMIRNTANGRSIEGALFRRERENPGPAIQVSADAAAALGLLAGSPTDLDVVALRREKPPEPAAPAKAEAGTPSGTSSGTGSAAPLAAAAAAIDRAEAGQAAAEAATAEEPAPKPAMPARPYVQIGLFSTEELAKAAEETLRGAGIAPTIRTQKGNGRTFWRVLAGPAASAEAREALWKKARSLGYEDAYYVTR